MENKVILWKGQSEMRLPANISKIEEIVAYGAQLSSKDKKNIVTAFNTGNYQMLSTYVWAKCVNALKSQLAKMGAAFIGEMLNRPEITDGSNLQHLITDFESIQLAEELGIVSGTGAFRMKQSFELINHFNNPDLIEDEGNSFTREDAINVVKSSIQTILGHQKIEFALDFKNFRNSLENEILKLENPLISKLLNSPYFFQMATIRILLALIKSSNGAQLENSISNATLIIPNLWSTIRQPEKWQVGRCYAELFADGKTTATNGLKTILLKVKGFDFVPEDLRSTSFIKAANEILKIHEGVDNYYNEPPAVMNLSNMGSTIPMPAFSVCMSALLSVRVGNAYGVSWAAQDPANKLLNALTAEKWKYYFDECLTSDERILNKLAHNSPKARWFDLINSIGDIKSIIKELKDKDIKEMLNAVITNKNRVFDGSVTGLNRRRISSSVS